MKIIKTIAIAVLALGIFACGGGKKEGSVVGNWKLKKTEGYEVGGLGSTKINFEENGSYKWSTGIFDNVGTYKISNDTLKLTQTPSNMATDYTMKFQDGLLLMTLVTAPQYQVTYFFE